ncbi:aspartate/glutamate racemase family protein [Methylobacterium nodulans]|uniref:Asp/Glu/hydantoin racemase n=1 Tax=Methylobacterium nodulans (strain LMG 21967 / CNCM I-2342 / ORS 2060) TaxID=460265 RepID=B8ISU3_METNO|nr:aspartate/glutamate racemase family protein [Methylobacterium nodulans]ACL60742.1 Asp/Glu/hydantoin racemase [Methylobacterium nodulans ORS 2060]
MRLLLINPNTSVTVTDLAAVAVRRVLPAVEVRAVTGRFGGRYVASRATYAIAAHAALDVLAEHVAGCEAVYLACFGDPGLLALKEVSPVPVVGMAEGSLHLAGTRGRRIGVVTGGAAWKPMLEEFAATLGLAGRIAGIRTIAPTGAEIARDPDAALARLAAACRACAEEDAADVVVLGGAALAGLAARIAPEVPVPVLCSVEAGARMAFAAAQLQAGRPPPPAMESVGLGPALADLLAKPA